MAAMKDSENKEIPLSLSDDGNCLFDINMTHWYDKETPTLLMSIPYNFKTKNGEYNGDGVLSLELKSIFEEYLDSIIKEDGGKNAESFVIYLRSYAKRIECKVKNNSKI